jgi:hypothetical protein
MSALILAAISSIILFILMLSNVVLVALSAIAVTM